MTDGQIILVHHSALWEQYLQRYYDCCCGNDQTEQVRANIMAIAVLVKFHQRICPPGAVWLKSLFLPAVLKGSQISLSLSRPYYLSPTQSLPPRSRIQMWFNYLWILIGVALPVGNAKCPRSFRVVRETLSPTQTMLAACPHNTPSHRSTASITSTCFKQ